MLHRLRAEGHPVGDEDLAHLSPVRYAHVNPCGRYHFDLGGAGSDDEQPNLPGVV